MKPFIDVNSTTQSVIRRVMRLPETCRTAGVVDMTLRRMEKAGTFPKRFKINPDGGLFGAVGYDYDEVQEWVEKRLASRDGEAADA